MSLLSKVAPVACIIEQEQFVMADRFEVIKGDITKQNVDASFKKKGESLFCLIPYDFIFFNFCKDERRRGWFFFAYGKRG